MDVLASTIQRDPSWAMLYADDLVICHETRLEVEQQLDSWREVLEGNGLRISRKKTDYLRPAGSSEEVCTNTMHQLIQVGPTWALQSKQPDDVEQMSITEYDQRGTRGEGYLG